MNQLRGHSIRSAALEENRGGGEFAPLATATSSPEQAFFRLDIWRSLQLHWKLARTVALGFVALAILYVLAQVFWFKSWPTYMAVSTVYVQPSPAKVLEGGTPRWPFDSNTYETYIQQQMMNVSREDVLASAVHKLPGFAAPGESDQSASARLVRSLEVDRIPEAYQFTISARAGTAQAAADIANAVTAAYIESASRDEHTGDAQRLAALKEERSRIQAALAADHAEQDELNKQLGVASVAATVPDHYDEDITQIRTELAKARTDHDVAEQKFASLDAGHGPSSSAIDAQADEMVGTDAGLVSMKQSFNTRRSTLISQMTNMTPANPEYKQDEAELVKINGTLEAMMKDLRAKAASRIQLQLRADLQRTAGVESQLNGQLRQLVGAATSATPKMQRSSDLAADITRLQARYAAVDEQWNNVTLEDTAPAAASQVLPASPPLTRTKSGALRNAILISFAGLFFGVVAAIGAHRLDPIIYVAADVEHVLGFAPLALLPDFHEVSEAVAEEYMLRLSAAIEHGRKQADLKNCIFTGTGSGTGVSTVVNRVGAMLEAMGRPTVLVDATGAQAPPPISTAPASQFGLVPVQKSVRSSALLQKMAEENENEEDSLILTDTAPLLVSAETEYLARYVDCAIVVIESGVTTRAQLRQAASILQKLGVGAVGFVLNRIGLAKADPAFRSSIEAVEKHLEAQGNPAARRPERHATTSPDLKPGRDAAPHKVPAVRSNFEPEVAAAAAAVARFSPHPNTVSTAPSPTLPDSAVCRPSPLVTPPAAEAAKRFSLPLVSAIAEQPAKSAVPVAIAPDAASLPGREPAPNVAPSQVDEPHVVADPEVPPAKPASSPFASAAERVTSHLTSAPAISASPRPVPIETAPPEAQAERHAPVEPEVVIAAPTVEESPGPLSETAAPAAVHAEAPAHSSEEPAPVAHEIQAAMEIAAPQEMPAPQEVPAPPVKLEPASDSASDLPWWLSDTPRNAEPARPAVLWQPAKVWTTHTRGRLAEDEGAVASQYATSPESSPAGHFPLNGVPMETPAAIEPDATAQRTSRLSGLRNLLFVLGVKEVQNPAESSEPQAIARSTFERRPERQIYERTVVEADTHAERSVGGAAPRLVTAQPEFLPPKVVEFDKIDPRIGESQTRQDRRAASDGVDILPSRKGQYKKI